MAEPAAGRTTTKSRQPLGWVARSLLALSVVAIYFAFQAPLWTLSFESVQYPEPLEMAIYINHLEGQKTATRNDLTEIEGLNHFIGMQPLTDVEFHEFKWIPAGIIAFGVLALLVAAFGTPRWLGALLLLYAGFGVFCAWDFYRRMYSYGHDLAPDAAITVDPFMPPIFSTQKIANFWIESYPGGGSYALVAFGALMFSALAVTVLGHCRRLRNLARNGGA